MSVLDITDFADGDWVEIYGMDGYREAAQINTDPTGTTIQNLRTSYIGDNLTVDGYHLSIDKGRFAAALTWFSKITGLPIDGITYKPDGVTEQDLLNIKAAVNNAIASPYTVTNSSFLVDNDE